MCVPVFHCEKATDALGGVLAQLLLELSDLEGPRSETPELIAVRHEGKVEKTIPPEKKMIICLGFWPFPHYKNYLFPRFWLYRSGCL